MWEFATCQIWICKDNWFGGCQILLSKEKWKRCFKSGSIHPKNEDSRVQEIIPTFWDPTINNKRQKFSFLQWSGSHICPELTIFQNKSIKHLWQCYCSAQSSFFFPPSVNTRLREIKCWYCLWTWWLNLKLFSVSKSWPPTCYFFFFFYLSENDLQNSLRTEKSDQCFWLCMRISLLALTHFTWITL